jgi:putative hydrolase of the HAD superfamily
MTPDAMPFGGAEGAERAPVRGLAHPHAVRAVFFDVGYTLLAPYPSVVDVAERALDELGLSVERACLEQHLPAAERHLQRTVRAAPQTWADNQAINTVWAGYFTELLGPCLPELGEERLRETVALVFNRFEHHTSYALYSDVVPVLRTLHARGLTLGVISDWGIGLGPILHAHGLNQYFDFAVVSAALRHAKPHPWLFEIALQRADAIPDYTIHIGDSYVLDVLGARSVGIEAVLIDRPGRIDPGVVDVPVVRDLYGLLDLLELERDGIDDIGGA